MQLEVFSMLCGHRFVLKCYDNGIRLGSSPGIVNFEFLEFRTFGTYIDEKG